MRTLGEAGFQLANYDQAPEEANEEVHTTQFTFDCHQCSDSFIVCLAKGCRHFGYNLHLICHSFMNRNLL